MSDENFVQEFQVKMTELEFLVKMVSEMRNQEHHKNSEY